MLIYFILWVPVVCSVILMFATKTAKAITIFNWIVIGGCALVSSHLFLIDVANDIKNTEMSVCMQTGQEIVSTGLSGYCPGAIDSRSEWEKIIVHYFGGMFDGIFTLLLGAPLVLLLALFGVFNEKRTWGEISRFPLTAIVVLLPLSILGTFLWQGFSA